MSKPWHPQLRSEAKFSCSQLFVDSKKAQQGYREDDRVLKSTVLATLGHIIFR